MIFCIIYNIYLQPPTRYSNNILSPKIHYLQLFIFFSTSFVIVLLSKSKQTFQNFIPTAVFYIHIIMETLGKLNDLIKSCLLPELKHDLDSIPIEREHFKAYHESLELQLPVLYDWIQQSNNLIWNSEASDTVKHEVVAIT